MLEKPQKKYGAILADPPWRFSTWSAKGRDRCPDNITPDGHKHYSTMTLDDIKALPVEDFAADDCILFLWATDPMLPQALDVGAAWGFAYKTTAFVWAKTCKDDSSRFPIGTGYWTRANPELCLLFTRGKPKRLSASVRKLLLSPRREHSRKPDEVYGRIESLVSGPYLELFARQKWPGWDFWGNQVDRF